MLRAFFGIRLSTQLTGTFAACREVCVAADPAWAGEKWVAPENLHVTLRFLGDLPEGDVERCIDVVSDGLTALRPWHLRLDLVRAIPRPRSASLLWVSSSQGIEDTAAAALAISRVTAFLDYQSDDRPFRPHATLCRARRPRSLSPVALDEIDRFLRLTEAQATSMSVSEVTLFASTLTPRGPVYEDMATIRLGQ